MHTAGRRPKQSRKTRPQLRKVQKPKLKRDLDRMAFFAITGWGVAVGAILFCVYGI